MLTVCHDGERKVVFIPGGSAGIGAHLARSLAATNYRVAVCGRGQPSPDLFAETKTNENLQYFQCDICRPGDINKTLRDIALSWASISILINCVGPFRSIALEEETLEGWNETIDANLNSAFSLYQCATPYLLKHTHSRIISFTISKAEQLLGRKRISAYYCAKAALIALTRAYAVNYAAEGLTANIISLGDIRKNIETSIEKDRAEETRDLEENTDWPILNIPAKRLGNHNDVGCLVNYLIHPSAQYTNGALVDVSGAWACA